MSLRDKALIGELRRDNERLQHLLSQANERLASVEQEVEILRAAGAELERELTALLYERTKVGESIKQTLDKVAESMIEEDRPLYIPPEEMYRHPIVRAVKALIQNANNISSAGREHFGVSSRRRSPTATLSRKWKQSERFSEPSCTAG